jgi:hypothetical protein
MKTISVNSAELAESTLTALEANYDYFARNSTELLIYKNTLRLHKDLLCLFHTYKEYDLLIITFGV